MRSARLVAFVAFVALAGPAACVHRIEAPTTPFGHPVAAMAAPALDHVPEAALGGRTVVVGPIDSEITQPIGGVYDRRDFEHSPFVRAWFVPEIATLLGDALVNAVRRHGGVGLRETSGVLVPEARSLPLRREGSEQWRVRVVAMEHDLVSADDAEHPYAELAARLVVVRVPGGRVPGAESERTVDVHLRIAPNEDALAVLADAIVAALVRP